MQGHNLIARRRLKGQLKARDEKIARLNAEVTHLRKLTEPGKVFNHVYPAQIIVLAVYIVVTLVALYVAQQRLRPSLLK
jgi:hypothetical protein